MKFPRSILISLFLYVAETILGLYLSSTYSTAVHRIWLYLTLLFCLLPCLLVQICFVCFHMEFFDDRSLEHLFHLLQLGPLFRCVQVLRLYFIDGKSEDPYDTLIKRKQLSEDGGWVEVEQEVGRVDMLLSKHSSAFRWASFIQAFFGSAPQLILQLYISISQQHISLCRCMLMSISLLSFTYGALQCNILAIRINYEDYDFTFRPAAYLCLLLWRFLEISCRVVVLGLFSSVFKTWTLCVVALNLLAFMLYSWISFWKNKSSGNKNGLSKCRTATERAVLNILYSVTSIFCWCPIQVELSEPDLITKSNNWCRITMYYMLRHIENAVLIFLWYIYQTDVYSLIGSTFLVALLLVGYTTSMLFMLIFYQFLHPCRTLFTSSFVGGLMSGLKSLCCMCKPSRAPTNEHGSEVCEP
ncbi:endoplasmic reticulum membrane adapter protein XK-like [Spea bombifrons]|uniref:endoplasmic reticulum membrane adapter protein XK-like n=1 Tax=Spea bombifrons TaxID=233779 RepID=UPI00234B33C5|nr:endoplasmic reticulum membrane adapter protein XK-like [Spea bombifrons]XP_053311973.1 endoplasmic reticulum membrane adapter protein XK-like [Spea bombifrons]